MHNPIKILISFNYNSKVKRYLNMIKKFYNYNKICNNFQIQLTTQKMNLNRIRIQISYNSNNKIHKLRKYNKMYNSFQTLLEKVKRIKHRKIMRIT